MKYIIAASAVVIVVVGIFLLLNRPTNNTAVLTNTSTDQKTDTNTSVAPAPAPTPTGAPKEVDKTTRVATLKAEGQSGITGDGNILNKSGKATVGIKIKGAQELPAGSWYEAYFDGFPGGAVSLGKFGKASGETNAYVLGSQGPDFWFGATKLIITKETKDDGKPEAVVAQGSLVLLAQ